MMTTNRSAGLDTLKRSAHVEIAASRKVMDFEGLKKGQRVARVAVKFRSSCAL
jgi:hypothetical protein